MDDGCPEACSVIGWNDAYWWCANLWMAFAVFFQIYKMLKATKRLQRYEPPELKRIIKESTMIHVFSIFMATLTVIPINFIPKAVPSSSCEAYPEPGNSDQNVFYWAFYMPVTTLIPTFLVTILCVHIWYEKLLPVNGNSRSLLFYFARLVAVIYIVSIAVVVSFFFENWVQAVAFVVFNLVGLIQVCLALCKEDIRKAWVQMWCCRKHDEVPDFNLQSESAVTKLNLAAFIQSTTQKRLSRLGSRLSSMTWHGKGKVMPRSTTGVHNPEVTGSDAGSNNEDEKGVEVGKTSNGIRVDDDVFDDIDLEWNDKD